MGEPREEFVLEVAVIVYHTQPESFEGFLRAPTYELVSELVVLGSRKIPSLIASLSPRLSSRSDGFIDRPPNSNRYTARCLTLYFTDYYTNRKALQGFPFIKRRVLEFYLFLSSERHKMRGDTVPQEA